MPPIGIVARATIVITLISVLSKILGFAREAVIASEFGATSATDAYLVVFNLAYMAYGLLSGALVAVVVPVLTGKLVRGEQHEVNRVFSTVGGIVFVIIALVAGLSVWKSHLIIGLFAPGFNEPVARLATQLAVIVLPSVVFMGLGSLFMGLLNTYNIFAPSAFAGPVLNLTIIIAALTLGRVYGIHGLAFGVLMGSIALALVQVPFLKKTGFSYRPVLNMGNDSVKTIFKLMVPILLSSGIGQVNILIYYFFGSSLVEGSISALNYATKLVLLPQGIFVLAITTAVFPTLSRFVAEKAQDRFIETIIKGTKMISLMAIPAAVGLLILREPVIKLLFMRGAFDERALAMTSGILFFLAFGLIGQCLGPLFTRGFFAHQDTITPVKITIVAVALNAVLSFFLISRMQYMGLALSNTIISLLTPCLLAFILNKRVPGLLDKSLLRFLANICLASVIMGGAVYICNTFLVAYLPATGTALALRVVIDITFGGLVYLGLGFMLKIEEFRYLLDLARSIIKR
ncbi:MAG TPA: murein biosynthesis integral membrane protein MurJ [Clostridia bacterium]|nr:murein biosynthesis integral membrane protein MurJ [Clostridia bacterium]